jgi:hypothetical protein
MLEPVHVPPRATPAPVREVASGNHRFTLSPISGGSHVLTIGSRAPYGSHTAVFLTAADLTALRLALREGDAP